MSSRREVLKAGALGAIGMVGATRIDAVGQLPSTHQPITASQLAP